MDRPGGLYRNELSIRYTDGRREERAWTERLTSAEATERMGALSDIDWQRNGGLDVRTLIELTDIDGNRVLVPVCTGAVVEVDGDGAPMLTDGYLRAGRIVFEQDGHREAAATGGETNWLRVQAAR